MFSIIYQMVKFNLSLSKFMQMALNSFLFRFLPFSISRWYLMVLGRIYYFLNPKEKTLIRKTMHHAFQKKFPSPVLNRKIRAAFIGIFDHYHEKLFVAYSNFPRLVKFLRSRVRFTGEADLEAALQAGTGVILVTGHFGAVEFLPGALALNGYPTSIICRFQTNRLRKSLGARAEAVGLRLIEADGGNIIVSAMKALKQGGILITECDEFDEWRPDPHRDSSFLNCKLPFDRTLELLQKRSGARVITALVQRQGKKHYTCNLKAVDTGASPLNQPLTGQCLSVLEQAVERYPEQWYQWKKFGAVIEPLSEIEPDQHSVGYLPNLGLPIPHQA